MSFSTALPGRTVQQRPCFLAGRRTEKQVRCLVDFTDIAIETWNEYSYHVSLSDEPMVIDILRLFLSVKTASLVGIL